jgi:hypothetical protein
MVLTGCQSVKQPVAYRDGSTGGKTIEFSGYQWLLKESTRLVGPGPNHFSSDRENVWVDDEGSLHLRITHRGDQWRCPELVCQTPMGYGKYVFYVGSRVDEVDPNVVVGLFTWDDETADAQANCEIDIEFTRWTEANAPNLHYSVQPARGPDDPSGRYKERYTAERMTLEGDDSTHLFEWSPKGLLFASYQGQEHPSARVIKSWAYSADNPPRRSGIDGISQPVGVPVPGPDTRLRINLWLVDGNGDGRGDVPTDGQEAEIVIDRFEYTPLAQQ